MMIYLLLFVGTMAMAGIASYRVRSTYNKYAKLRAASGLTGAQVAQRILATHGIGDVSIDITPGHLTDHYDPSNRRLVLSEENYHGTSVAALGVAAHEAGHAIQHKQLYAPLQWRMAAVGITNIASQMVMWIPLIGFAGNLISPGVMLTLMALGMGVIMLFQLVTLPVEFDATARAKHALITSGAVAQGPEFDGMSKVLNAAALTYVAAFLSSLAYFLFYVVRLLGAGRDE
jgi:Zn-dependent membrane protease YugP